MVSRHSLDIPCHGIVKTPRIFFGSSGDRGVLRSAQDDSDRVERTLAEVSSSPQWDAIKIPVGGLFAEGVAGLVRARRNVFLQHLRCDAAQLFLGLKS